jgi:trehalose 6-phosphate synthase/phosphatase
VRIIYLGDDQTDEDAFRVLAGLGVTFRIGTADSLSLADRRLPNVDAVQSLLEWLASRPPARAVRELPAAPEWVAQDAGG